MTDNIIAASGANVPIRAKVMNIMKAISIPKAPVNTDEVTSSVLVIIGEWSAEERQTSALNCPEVAYKDILQDIVPVATAEVWLQTTIELLPVSLYVVKVKLCPEEAGSFQVNV